MMVLSRLRAPVLAAVCGLLAGCYSYRAAPPDSLRDGDDVRVRLTPDGSAAIAATAGLRVQTLEGLVRGPRADGALLVQPRDVTTLDGDALPWRRGTISVPMQSLAGTERRTLSRRRTTGLASAITAVFTGVVVIALQNIRGGGSSNQGGPPGPRE
jgi:hypothetical protein